MVALQNWFAIVDDSDLNVTEKLYADGKLNGLYELTQLFYKNVKKVDKVHVFRWETSKRMDKILVSWTPNKNDAMEYKYLRGNGTLLEADVKVSDILFCTEFLSGIFELDEELGMIPCDEIVVINN